MNKARLDRAVEAPQALRPAAWRRLSQKLRRHPSARAAYNERVATEQALRGDPSVWLPTQHARVRAELAAHFEGAARAARSSSRQRAPRWAWVFAGTAAAAASLIWVRPPILGPEDMTPRGRVPPPVAAGATVDVEVHCLRGDGADGIAVSPPCRAGDALQLSYRSAAPIERITVDMDGTTSSASVIDSRDLAPSPVPTPLGPPRVVRVGTTRFRVAIWPAGESKATILERKVEVLP